MKYNILLYYLFFWLLLFKICKLVVCLLLEIFLILIFLFDFVILDFECDRDWNEMFDKGGLFRGGWDYEWSFLDFLDKEYVFF